MTNQPETVIKAALYYLVLLPNQDHTGILNTLPLIPLSYLIGRYYYNQFTAEETDIEKS